MARLVVVGAGMGIGVGTGLGIRVGIGGGVGLGPVEALGGSISTGWEFGMEATSSSGRKGTNEVVVRAACKTGTPASAK